MRRYRELSQAQLATAAGTSQAAIARVENQIENITLSTLQKLVTALKGRVRFSIQPEEIPADRTPAWWERHQGDRRVSTTRWMLAGVAWRQTAETEQLILGFQRTPGLAEEQVTRAHLLPEAKAS